MGERLRWVISVDEDTQLLADRWQEQFSPLVGSNRSSLVRLVFKTLDRLGFTAATITAALAQSQELRRITAEQDVAQCHTPSQQFPAQAFPVDGRAKPLKRIVAHPSKGARQREVRGVSRRTAASVAWGTSLATHFTRFSRRAA